MHVPDGTQPNLTLLGPALFRGSRYPEARSVGATIPFSLCDADEGRLHNEGSVFKLHTVTSVDLSNRSGRWRQVSFVRRGRTIWSEPIRTESSPSQAFVQQLLGVAADGFHRRSGGHK